MANNQNTAMPNTKVTMHMKNLVSQYAKADTMNHRKELVSNYRTLMTNENMKKVNQILAEEITRFKRHEIFDPKDVSISFIPLDLSQNVHLRTISGHNTTHGYSMIVRTRGGEFFFAKSLIEQKEFMMSNMPQSITANQQTNHNNVMRNAFYETLKYLVELIKKTRGVRIQSGDTSNFRQSSDNIANLIIPWLKTRGQIAPAPVAVHKVNVNSTRTNSLARMSIYFQEVFAKLHTHGSKLVGYSDSYTRCPALPLLLDVVGNDSFVQFVTKQRAPTGSKTHWTALGATITFVGGKDLYDYLSTMWSGYNFVYTSPSSVPPHQQIDDSFTKPLSRLMNDHYMNLWSLSLQPSTINRAVLSTVTQGNIDRHFAIDMPIHELMNQHRTITYESSTGTSVIMCSNKYITKNQTPRQGVTFSIGELFADFVQPTPEYQSNQVRLNKRTLKKANTLNLTGELQKIDPLLQQLNSLRLGQSTRNINKDRNNENIRMNHNSNRTPAILFVETVFRLILSHNKGFAKLDDKLEFENDLRRIYSTFTVPRTVNAKKLKVNRTNVISTNSNVTRAMKGRNNATMRNVNLTRIKQLVIYMKRNFQVIFKYSQSGNDSSIQVHKGQFSLGISILNDENEWDYISWFLSNVGSATGENNPILTKLRTIHKHIVSAVFALITEFHSQFVEALLQPITENTNNISTRLHNLNAEQMAEAVSMCYSVAHAELFARNKGYAERTYGDEANIDGTARRTDVANHLPGYSIPAGLMFDCRLPIYTGDPQSRHHTHDDVMQYGLGRQNLKDGLPGFLGNTAKNGGQAHYCNFVDYPGGEKGGHVEEPMSVYAGTFGNHHLLNAAKHGKTVADIKQDGLAGLATWPLISKLSMNPDHMLGYLPFPAEGERTQARQNEADIMNIIMKKRYVSNQSGNVSREAVVERFMNRKKTSSAAAYLWYDCGDTHAMRSATQATLKLVLQLRQIGFLEEYPINGYTASTSPLFEQSVILKQTGVLCAPIFLEALRRQVSRLNEVTSYVSYNEIGANKTMETRNTRVRKSVNITTVQFDAAAAAAAVQERTLAELVLFSPLSIHEMGGIEYKKVSQSFIDSISNRSNNIPTNKVIKGMTDFALSLHQHFMKIYTSVPAYKNSTFRFYLVNDNGTMPYTANNVEELDSVDLLKRLMNFDYWKLRRSFWVSHFMNLKIIRGDDVTMGDKTMWNVSDLETPKAKESLSLLERVLAYWQMYNHADRRTGITNRTIIKQKINAGILDDFGSSKRFHRGIYGSRGNTLNDRLNMEYSMAVEKSKQMRESLKSKFR
jgi:hypothetical protein